MAITRLQIRQALAETARQADPTKLHVSPYLTPKITTPAVCVGDEVIDYVGAMGGGMALTEWRIWFLANPGGDWLEAQRITDEYLDFTGEHSLYQAFKHTPSHTPAWFTAGLRDVKLLRYARMPADIQGPNLIDWMGSVYWGVPIVAQVRYGTE